MVYQGHGKAFTDRAEFKIDLEIYIGPHRHLGTWDRYSRQKKLRYVRRKESSLVLAT